MAKTTHRLTAIKVQSLKVPGMYPDGAGLYLRVKDTGAKSWVFRFMLNGRPRYLGLGPASGVTLAKARELANSARETARSGIDPIEHRRDLAIREKLAEARALTFKQVAEQVIANNEDTWKNSKHRSQWKNTLTTYVYPTVGNMSVGKVTTDHVLEILKPIWTSKPETASRVRGRIETILNAAKTLGAREGENPAVWRGHLSNLLPRQAKTARVQHHPAMQYADVPGFVAKLNQHTGFAALAFRFLILTACRTGEVLGAQWEEIDKAAGIWIVPGDRMKAGREHRVPLSQAASDVLREAEKIKLNEFIFPGQKPERPLSNMALLMLLRRFDLDDVTAHGFRSAFSDWAHEETSHPNHVIEMTLAHTIDNKVEAAYRRADLLEKRRALMLDWAEYCGSEKNSR